MSARRMIEQVRSTHTHRPGGLRVVLCLSLLLGFGIGDLAAQERLGRQRNLSPDEVAALRASIQERGGQVIIGFKPVEAEQGMRADGTPALLPAAVSALAQALLPLGVDVRRQFHLIPAIAATMDPAELETLLADPNVDYVEAEALYEPFELDRMPAEPPSIAPVQTVPWGIDRVDAMGAWGLTRGAGAKVGIIDTGIDEDHPDLNVLGGINLVTDGTERSDWDDNSPTCSFTHGTHVAGSTAAVDNDIHVVGVAPEVDLHALRVFDPENADISGCFALTNHIIAALEHATDNDFDVVNMSLGRSFPQFGMADAVLATHSAGVVVVAAAGNSGTSVGFPAGFPHAIATGAMDQFDDIAFFSSHGPEVDVAGPGVGVLSTFGGGGTAFSNGTSMASPHVAGVAALVRSARPDLTPNEVRSVLCTTADDLGDFGFDYFFGCGVVQAGAAVKAVAGADLAIAFVPGAVMAHAEPDGTPVVNAVEIRNVGASGTLDWSADETEDWMSVNPTSGTASLAEPSAATLEITTDPTGLSPGIYEGDVTVTGNAANSPATLSVRFAVAPVIPLDATVTTAGEIETGKRTRFMFTGSTRQAVDIAVLTDDSHANPLDDPFLRLFGPDGETLLTLNDDAAFGTGLGVQSLLYDVSLPEDGTYLVEVGSFGDFTGGGFLLKARPTGPILAVDNRFPLLRTEQDGDPAQTVVSVVNLTGVGSIDFSVETFGSWLSADPTSGTAETTGGHVAPGISDKATAVEAEEGTFPTARRDDRYSSAEEERWHEGWERTGGLRDHFVAGPQSVDVTLTADPTGLGQGPHFGSAEFTPTNDEWLQNTIDAFVLFIVFSPGMATTSAGHESPWGLTSDTPDQAWASTSDDNGSVFPLDADGLPGSIVTQDVLFPAGLTKGQDGNLYVGSRLSADPSVWKVNPDDGTAEPFVTMPATPFWTAAGPAGEFYVSVCFVDRVYRVSADGSEIEPFGPRIDCPLGVAFNPHDESIYVGTFGGVEILGLDGSVLGSIADDVQAAALVVGRSTNIYMTDFEGQVWCHEGASSRLPCSEAAAAGTATAAASPANTEATFLGQAPSPFPLYGVALVRDPSEPDDPTKGALLLAENAFGEFYRFPVNDTPVPPKTIRVRLNADDVAGLQGSPFSVPVEIAWLDGESLAATYDIDLVWDPTELVFHNLPDPEPGDFCGNGGVFIANTEGADEGRLAVVCVRPDGLGDGVFTLFTLDLSVDRSVAPGNAVDLGIQLNELASPEDQDLLIETFVETPGQICLSQFPFGDVTLDGVVSGSDAVQILRHLVGLELAPGTDLSLADVSGNGEIGIEDVIQILRHLVELPLPADSRVALAPVGPCA